MSNTIEKNARRTRRHKRIRGTISGTSEKPRLAVFKSNTAIYAQLIDDDSSTTLAASKAKAGKNGAVAVGKDIAEKAKAKKITEVVFDRGGFIFTGNIKALAESAREAGLKF